MASRPHPVRRNVERRNNGLLRVPFIRRCALAFDDGTSSSTFTVNINVLGAYVARDQMPQLSQAVTITMATPGKDVQLVLRGDRDLAQPAAAASRAQPAAGLRSEVRRALARGPPLHRGRDRRLRPPQPPDVEQLAAHRRYAALSSLTR